jgi:CBS domain-containing protein
MTSHDSPGRPALVPLSYLRHRKVVDARGRSAPLLDLAVDPRDGEYPKVGWLVVGGRNALRELAASRLGLLAPGLDLRIDDLTAAPMAADKRPHEFLLIHDLLDSLIIDLQRRGAARVNDVLLEQHDDGLRLKAVDTGPWAIVRRLTRGRWPSPSEADLSDWKYVAFLRGSPDRQSDEAPCGHIARLPPGEIARLSNALPYLQGAELLRLLPASSAAEVFAVLAPERQIQMFEELDEEYASHLLALLAPDTTTDLLARLDPVLARNHLAGLPEPRRTLVLELLQYPEHTVGGIMTNDVVLLPEHATVAEASRHLHECLSTPAFVYYVYVVDDLESRHLRGMVTLRDLPATASSTLGSPPRTSPAGALQLGQQVGHLLRAPREQRQHPTLELLLQSAYPRPLQHDRPRLHGQAARLPVPVAVADRRVDPGAAFVPLPAEQLRHLHLQKLLNELLDLPPNPGLQRLPRRPGLRVLRSATALHGRCLRKLKGGTALIQEARCAKSW